MDRLRHQWWFYASIHMVMIRGKNDCNIAQEIRPSGLLSSYVFNTTPIPIGSSALPGHVRARAPTVP